MEGGDMSLVETDRLTRSCGTHRGTVKVDLDQSRRFMESLPGVSGVVAGYGRKTVEMSSHGR
jgi:hypothetical protein